MHCKVYNRSYAINSDLFKSFILFRNRVFKLEILHDWTPPGHRVSPLVYRGQWMSTVVLYCWCHSDNASVLLYSTLIRFNEFCLGVAFVLCCGCDTSYIVLVNIQFQASIYTLSLCRGHSWRVWLAKQETLTPPGHLVSPLVYRGPWMSTVVLYCWYHSDSVSVFCIFFL